MPVPNFSPDCTVKHPDLILRTTPASGIAMRQDTVDFAEWFESAYG
jgi:hypothetical protein